MSTVVAATTPHRSPLVWWPQTRPEVDTRVALALVALCTGTNQVKIK